MAASAWLLRSRRVVGAQPGRTRDLERGHQQAGVELLQVGVGDLVAVTGSVGQELDDVPPVQPRRPSAAMRLLVRRDRRQPVIEDRQRGPPAEGVLLVLGPRVEDDGDRAAVVVRDPGEPDRAVATSGKRLPQNRRYDPFCQRLLAHAGRSGEEPGHRGLRAAQPARMAGVGQVREQGPHRVAPDRVRQFRRVTACPLVGRPGTRLRVALIGRPRHVLADRVPGHVIDGFPVELEHHDPIGAQPGSLIGVLGDPVLIGRRVVLIAVQVHDDPGSVLVGPGELHVRDGAPGPMVHGDLPVRAIRPQCGGGPPVDGGGRGQRDSGVGGHPVLEDLPEPGLQLAFHLAGQRDLPGASHRGGRPVLQQVVQHGKRLGAGDEGPFVVVDMAEQAAVAGALAVVRAPAPGDDIAGTDQDLPKLLLVGEPVQVPGAAGEGVVQHEELATASGFLVGHGCGDDREVVGVAAVLLRHAGHQRCGERRNPLVHQGGGHREQDPDRFGVQHMGEDQLSVVAGAGAAPLGAPQAVVARLTVAGADQRVGVAGSGWLVRGRAAARDAAGMPRAEGGWRPGGLPSWCRSRRVRTPVFGVS